MAPGRAKMVPIRAKMVPRRATMEPRWATWQNVRSSRASAASDASGALQMMLAFKVYFEVSKCSSGKNRFAYIFTGFV